MAAPKDVNSVINVSGHGAAHVFLNIVVRVRVARNCDYCANSASLSYTLAPWSLSAHEQARLGCPVFTLSDSLASYPC